MKLNKINLSGVSYDIEDLNAAKTVEITQAQYDALAVKDPNTFYIITDAEPVDMSDYYTKDEVDDEITAATSGKQDTLVSGTNIKTVNNESLLGSGNINIQGGGATSGITYDTPFITSGAFLRGQWYGFITDFGTVNPTGKQYVRLNVNGSLVNIGFNGSSDFYDGSGNLIDVPSYINQELNIWDSANKRRYIFFKDGVYVDYIANTGSLKYTLYAETHSGDAVELVQDHIFNDSVHTTSSEKDLWNTVSGKVETSAITSAITSASTDSQVPSAKAVYDALQESGGGTVDTELDDTSENPVQNKVIYQKFDEVEEVTAAALNALNDKIGDINTLLEGI